MRSGMACLKWAAAAWGVLPRQSRHGAGKLARAPSGDGSLACEVVPSMFFRHIIL